MASIKKSILLSTFYYLLLPLGNAQSLIEPVLLEPIQQAVSENAEVKIKLLEQESTIQEAGVVKAKKLPQISADAGYGYLFTRTNIDLPTQYLPITGRPIFDGSQSAHLKSHVITAGISVQQVIFAGLQIPNGIKALEEKEKSLQFQAEAGKETVAKEVITTFDQLMLLNEIDILIDDSEKRLNKEHQKVIKAIENGLAIPYDREKIKLAMLELEEKKLEVENNRNLLYSKLQYLTKMSKAQLEAITYKLQPIDIDIVHLSPNNRAELKALEAGKKAKEYVYLKEKGTKLPTIFAFGNLSYVNALHPSLKLKDIPIFGDVQFNANHLSAAPMTLVGAGIKWDIFSGGEKNKKIEIAKLDVEMMDIRLQDTQEKLNLLFEKTKNDYFSSKKGVAVVEQKIVVSKNNLHLASKQYSLGLTDLTERLASENDYYTVSLNYYNQILQQRSTAIELLHATGQLLDEIYK